MPKKLKQAFAFTFPAKVWNLMTDHAARYLYLEIRNEESHQVSFTSYDLKNKKLLWSDLHLEEDWWIGMNTADADLLVLHTFEDSENPGKKSFFVIDNQSRKVIWQDRELQVLDIYGNLLYGFIRKDHVTRYKCVSLETNRSQNLSLEEVEQALAEVSTENKYIRHPFHYTEEDTHFETLNRFIQYYLNCRILQACEYLEYEELVFISYYVKEAQALANYLLVVDADGELLLHEKLDDQLSNPGLGTFMCVRDQLIFIKQKRELLSYAI